jgi:hypothetical protein
MPLGLALFAASNAVAATEPVSQPVPTKPVPAAVPHVRYKGGKDVDFEALLINGQLQRPEISVVTGDSGADGNGLLRLREDFIDQLAADAGEKQ